MGWGCGVVQLRYRCLGSPVIITLIGAFPLALSQDAVLRDTKAGAWKQWQADSLWIRDKFEIPVGIDPWTKPLLGPQPRLCGVPPVQRIHEVLNCGWGALPEDERNVVELYANLSQGVKRKGTCGRSISICSGACVYSFELDRMLVPVELLAIMGVPVKDISFADFLSGADIRLAAANSMFAGSIGSVLAALVYNDHAEWWA